MFDELSTHLSDIYVHGLGWFERKTMYLLCFFLNRTIIESKRTKKMLKLPIFQIQYNKK